MPPIIKKPNLKPKSSFKKIKDQSLRTKSKVHKLIITKKGRRKKSLTGWVKEIIDTKKENWSKNGTAVALPKEIMLDLKKTKPNANIMVLGPGKGQEVVFISDLLKSKKANIDTLGLGNQLTEKANALVRKDYSPDLQTIKSKDLFEHMNHLKFVKKYDYIYTAYGPILHTKYAEVSILKVASMLKPGGVARIVPFFEKEPVYENKIKNIKNYLKKKKLNDTVEFTINNNNLIIYRKK